FDSQLETLSKQLCLAVDRCSGEAGILAPGNELLDVLRTHQAESVDIPKKFPNRFQVRFELPHASPLSQFVVRFERVEQFTDIDFFGSRIKRSNSLLLVLNFPDSLVEFLLCSHLVAGMRTFTMLFATEGVAEPPGGSAHVEVSVTALSRLGRVECE